jgi:hypothetical protein
MAIYSVFPSATRTAVFFVGVVVTIPEVAGYFDALGPLDAPRQGSGFFLFRLKSGNSLLQLRQGPTLSLDLLLQLTKLISPRS